MVPLKYNSLLPFLFALVLGKAGVQASAQEPIACITNASDVISLSAERAAEGLKVLVKGTVTAADPALKGRFFVQDQSGGVFVDNIGGRRPEPGDVVQVSGITHSGAFAPIITAPTVTQVGNSPLPPAKSVPIERLMSGAEDSQRVEISGLVRAARLDGPRLIIDMVSGGYRFRVYAPENAAKDPQRLIAAQVRVRGTAAEAHNRSLRQLLAVEIYVPGSADFVIERPESVDPFQQSIVPLSSLAQYRKENSLSERTHVKGIVTLQRAGQSLFLQDETGGLQVKSSQSGTFNPGDIVEAVGFPSFEGFLPVLEDAVFRRTSDKPVAIKPKAASIRDLQNGLHHADFVSLKAKIMDRTVRELATKKRETPKTRITFVLQAENVLFTAETEEPDDEFALRAIPIGSQAQVSGVCLKDIDSEGKLIAFRLLFGSAADIRILRKPSWLTPQRLLIGLGAVTAVLLLIVIWTITVSRKNTVLKFLIQEREKAQLELQKAHDQLEVRVKERTEQLKFEITARKEAEVQFKAILSERTRLAQELHDTLEQTLTGIGLQLDTAARLFQRDAVAAQHHLELSRNMMRQSQVELRRSVWDLRSRALEQFDLSEALRRSGKQMTEGTGIELSVETNGTPKPLPEIVEENLLRIGQEALTNIVKHAAASRAEINLNFDADKFTLQIRDNGVGFNPQACAGAHDGHFGLLGMTERAKRIGGQVYLSAAPGKGTTVRLEVPADAAHSRANGNPPREQI